MIVKEEDLEAVRRENAALRLVFAMGTFDLLHRGHLGYLEWARNRGDLLVVGVNNDAAVAARKGRGRPVIPEAERLEVVAGLRVVDHAVMTLTKCSPYFLDSMRLAQKLLADFVAIPADVTETEFDAWMLRFPAKAELAPRQPFPSTSEIIQRIARSALD